MLNSLLTISENMGIWVEFPLVIHILLLAWLEVTMCLFIHFLNSSIIILEGSTHWIDHIFGTLKTCAWDTEFHGALITLLWPFI